MRALPIIGLILVLGVAACAPRTVPVPVVDTPRYPEYFPPSVPAGMAESPAARAQDRAWQFLQAGDLRNAQREIESALRADPTFAPAEITAGYVTLARGNRDDAIARFTRTVERNPDNVSALIGLGQSFAAAGREQEAIARFEAALTVDPSLADVRRRVDVLKFRVLEQHLLSARDAARAGRLDEAEKAYLAALESSPESPFLYRELGEIEKRRADNARALELFRKATELDPGDSTSWLQIGAILESQGEFESALEAYDRAFAIDPAASTEELRTNLRARLEFLRLPPEYRAIEDTPRVTRGELAALIGVRLADVLRDRPLGEPVVLTDVRGDWAEQWIVEVAQAGIMDAYPNHTFQPQTAVTRTDLAAAVARLLPRVGSAGRNQPVRAAFSDLSTGHLAYAAASAAVSAGVMSVGPDQAFRPFDPVSGAEAIEAVQRIQALADPTASNSTLQ